MFDKKEKEQVGNTKVIGALAGIMVLLTAINMGFTYHMIGKKSTSTDISLGAELGDNGGIADKVMGKYLDEQYRMYGGRDNYEKVALMQAAQIDQQFGAVPLDKIKEDIKKQQEAVKAQQEADELSKQVQDLGDKNIAKAEYKKGKEDATITVYEHSDFNCVYCNKLHQSGVADKLVKEYDDLNFVQKNRPVIGGENSMMKATAAMCVGELGGSELYYKAQDALYTNREKADVISALVALGLDKKALTTCIDSEKYKEDLQATIEEGNKFGISGTPGSVVVNNKTGKFKVVKGAAPYEDFKAAVDELLAK